MHEDKGIFRSTAKGSGNEAVTFLNSGNILVLQLVL